MITIANILIPTDFSAGSAAALAQAKVLATQFGSRLHVLHVVAPPHAAWTGESTAFPWTTLLADQERDAREELKKLIPVTDPWAGRSNLSTIVDTPVAGILGYAKAHHIDLIVMGTHGRGFLGHMLLGSVAERVVRLAGVPVLTIRGQSIETGARNAAVAEEVNPPELVAGGGAS